MTRQAKPKYNATEFSVADAIESGVADLETLRDELQDWYDNLPENFQSGEKGSQLEEAISNLDDASGFDAGILTETGDTDADAPKYPGMQRFTYNVSTKTRQSRSYRRDEATGLLRGALDEVRAWIEREEKALNESGDDDEFDPNAAATEAGEEAHRDLIESAREAADELENLIDQAEGAEFPGMYG